MTLMSRLVKFVVFVAFGLALSGSAWANGEEFFHPDETGFDLYYFGHIKDKAGKVLDNVVITIKAKNLGMSFPVRNDAPGHFRSPDIGKAIKGLGKKVDSGAARNRRVQDRLPTSAAVQDGGAQQDRRRDSDRVRDGTGRAGYRGCQEVGRVFLDPA